jgi:hypothetical protein
MDISTFYAVTAATCFTLVGLWWSVVKSKPEWLANEATRRLAGGVYASFLVPALMSLGAQVGGTNPLIWQGVFIVAAIGGIVFSSRLIQLTHSAKTVGPFRCCMALFCFLLCSPMWHGFWDSSRSKWKGCSFAC